MQRGRFNGSGVDIPPGTTSGGGASPSDNRRRKSRLLYQDYESHFGTRHYLAQEMYYSIELRNGVKIITKLNDADTQIINIHIHLQIIHAYRTMYRERDIRTSYRFMI